ncbi:MAG: hemolysin D [Gammaproteobacteria bacterium]|jgi:hemolysin D
MKPQPPSLFRLSQKENSHERKAGHSRGKQTMSLFSKLKDAWQNRDKLGDATQTRELAAFLPAALEIQATPPHPLARWLMWSLIALLVLGTIWACVGQVNIVASAEGKIIPSSRVKQIQPLEKAVVKKILVKEGQYVAQGEALIELDNTLTSSDQTSMTTEVDTMQRNLAVSNAFIALLTQPPEKKKTLRFSDMQLQNIPTSTVIPAQAGIYTATQNGNGLYKQLLWQLWQQYWSQKLSLKNNLQKAVAEQAGTRAQIIKLQQTLPIITRRAEKVKALYQKNYASEDEYLALEQERIETTQDLATEKQRLLQLQAAANETKQQANTFTAQTQTEHLTKITDYQRQLATMTEELIKAKDLNAKQILYAPVAGRVQELAANTIGGVVTEAQQLMLIVPDQEQLEVEVFLENKDIGFVHEGMTAEIKIHTFPFTKYGIIDGEVITVSDDATVDEKRGLIYGMRLLMKKNTLFVEGKEVKLIPGMAVTAEMQTGHRRIIEFFLAPLLRYKKEGLRER